MPGFEPRPCEVTDNRTEASDPIRGTYLVKDRWEEGEDSRIEVRQLHASRDPCGLSSPFREWGGAGDYLVVGEEVYASSVRDIARDIYFGDMFFLGGTTHTGDRLLVDRLLHLLDAMPKGLRTP